MYLLKKVIQLREKSHPEHEKPFLEHLDDLRVMITRIVITLIIAMIVCFAYNNEIMAFFRKPVDEVMRKQLEATLPENAPKPLTTDLWKKALKVETSISSLNPPEREIFLKTLNDPNLAFHANSISLLRAAMALPEAQRESFINALEQDPILKNQVISLIKTHPKTETHTQGNLNMMSALKPTEGFMLSMKLSFVAGIVVSFPLLLLFILQFILPGLHSHEKRVLWPSMTIGFGLFLAGSAFAYYLVLPKALLFFYTWSGDMGISNDWRIGEYISFATQFTLLFGLSFELPVVVMVFVKLGLLTYDTMSKTRSYAILAIFIAAAILTPTPDIPTMLLMATPMIILYEICIWLAHFDQKKTASKKNPKPASASSEFSPTRKNASMSKLPPGQPTTRVMTITILMPTALVTMAGMKSPLRQIPTQPMVPLPLRPGFPGKFPRPRNLLRLKSPEPSAHHDTTQGPPPSQRPLPIRGLRHLHRSRGHDDLPHRILHLRALQASG